MRVSLSIYPGKIYIVKQAQLVVVQLSIINIKSKTKKNKKQILTKRWRVNLADYLRVVAYT
jgi:hypothetical protein